VHLLRYVVKCTVTDSPFNNQASCSNCPPSAWIVLHKVRSSLVTRVRKGIEADGGHFEQLA
jgi:hypothetical protein